MLPSSPSPLSDNIQDENRPIQGILDEESIAWWMAWRKRNEIAADAAVRGSSSSRRRAGGLNKQQRKKRKIVVDPDEDEDTHMFGDNEQEDDWKDKEKGKALLVAARVDFTDENFKPMALNEIKIDEQAMQEDIRILIKVCISYSISFFRRC